MRLEHARSPRDEGRHDRGVRLRRVLVDGEGVAQLVALDPPVAPLEEVLDQTELRVDDAEEEEAKQPADCAYWETKASPETVSMADELLRVVNEAAKRRYELNWGSPLTVDGHSSSS